MEQRLAHDRHGLDFPEQCLAANGLVGSAGHDLIRGRCHAVAKGFHQHSYPQAGLLRVRGYIRLGVDLLVEKTSSGRAGLAADEYQGHRRDKQRRQHRFIAPTERLGAIFFNVVRHLAEPSPEKEGRLWRNRYL